MAEQALDVRSALSILRRGRRLLAAAAAVGTLVGIGWVQLDQPAFTSTATVLLPPAADRDGQDVARDVKTEIRVAESDVVMGAAAQELTPPVSVRALLRQVDVQAPTTNVLQFTAHSDDAERAEVLAQTVAEAEVRHYQLAASSLTSTQVALLQDRQEQLQGVLDTVTAEMDATSARIDTVDPNSVAGKADASALSQLTAEQANLVLQIDEVEAQVAGSEPGTGATIIQEASPARRPGPLSTYGLAVLAGLVGCVVLTAVALLVLGKRDRRLRSRDEIADAVGRPVVASLRSRVPRTVAGWVSMLAGYAPGPVDAWALRQALHRLAPDAGTASGEPLLGTDGSAAGEGRPDRQHQLRSLTVITMSGDPRGLAIGPQLASYAASLGRRTRLVPPPGDETAAPLRAALAGATGDEVRPGLVLGTTDLGDEDPGFALMVVLVVVDRRRPELGDVPATEATVIAVSAGSATAEELARVALHADDAGSSVDAVLVADPDPLDRTTGRLLQRERAQQPALPGRMTGSVRVPPASNVAALRRKDRS